MEATTVDELNEWYQYFQMLLPKKEDEGPIEDGPVAQRRPRRASKYQTLVDSGVGSLAAKLVTDTDQFAKYVNTITQEGFRDMGEPPEDMLTIPDPEHEADIHLSARNDSSADPTPEQIKRCLSNTQFLLIKELQMHPLIRSKVREIVRRIAVVSTEPTEAGEQMLTPFHKYGSVKRMRQKPVEEMLDHYDDQFLIMVAAEKEGLLNLTVDVEPHELDEQLVRTMTNMYTFGIEADMHPSLYLFRKDIIKRVLQDHLVPMALQAVRDEMMKGAQNSVTDICCDELWVEVTTPPLQLKAIDDDEIATGDNMEVVRGQRVCVVCWGDKNRHLVENSTVMVMLDARGYPCDVLTLQQFSGLIPASPAHIQSLHEDDRKAEDAAAIVTFLEKHWPHLIVVGTTSMACWQLQEDIKKICEDEIAQEKRNENLSPLKNFTVRLVDDKLASIYESCSFAKSDLKDYPRLVRRATALGRHCMEPLALLCTLMMHKDDPELLALQVHPLQGLLPKAKRARAYEQLLITAIAQEGVCVNSCVQKDWLAPMLQFVPGLGPRKAQALLKGIKALPENDDYYSGTVPSQTIVARDHLLATEPDDRDHNDDVDDPWRPVRLLRHKVYANAAPFLRVTDPNEVHERNDDIFSIKDSMRVYPRDEEALLKIACAALDIADTDKYDEDPVQGAVGQPHKVMQVDISMYDTDWQERSGGKESRISTFTDLAMELVKPYGSVRPPERLDLTEEQCFWALNGEDRLLYRQGKMVTAKVLWVKKDLAGLVTDSGIPCHLTRSNAKSEEPQSLEHVLQKGMEIQARVFNFDYTNGGRLQLISRSEELANDMKWEELYIEPYDAWYHVIKPDERAANEKIKRDNMKKQKKSQIIHRPIDHGRFVNLSTYRVEQALKNPDWNNVDKLRKALKVDPKGAKDGDYVFYPSRKGTDRIVVCIRLFRRDNTVPVFQHIDFLETKSHKMGNQLALGTPLRLQHFNFLQEDETTFEEIPEIELSFIKPYVARFTEVLKFRKFAHGDRVQVNSVLNANFSKNSPPDYRLSLGFHPEASEKDALERLSVGWGTIALKTQEGVEPTHFPFRVCHKGYYCKFSTDQKSQLYTSVNGMVNAMKKSMQQQQKDQHQKEQARLMAAQAHAQQRQQQQYGGYPQMTPVGYQGHYGPHAGYGGSQPGFVGRY